ncbi:MAG: helix-turn-helix domain-containing protein [Anaerolineae bacterium]|nr:helix-turn-helix domain-containing protein [Anaerolineae bacterium]
MAALRRWKCAELLARGWDTAEIAAALGVSPKTVRRYRKQLLAEAAKTGICPICGARVIMGIGGEIPTT